MMHSAYNVKQKYTKWIFSSLFTLSDISPILIQIFPTKVPWNEHSWKFSTFISRVTYIIKK